MANCGSLSSMGVRRTAAIAGCDAVTVQNRKATITFFMMQSVLLPLSRRQASSRRRFKHELLIHNGSIDRQLGYFKLDGIFLLWSPDLYIRWEKHPIELPVFVIQELLVWLQVSSVKHDLAR